MSIDVYPNNRFFVTASYVTHDDTGIKFWELKVRDSDSNDIGG